MKRLGIVTALAPEAAIARRAKASGAHETTAPIVHFAGPGPDRAQRAARTLIAEGSVALLSFGVSGGLDPTLLPGDVVLADRLIGPDQTVFGTAPEWRDRLLRAGGDRLVMRIGDIAGVDQPVRHPRDKASLYRATGAMALDMESCAVARIAHDADIPFLVIRAIADPASRTIPEAAMRAMGPDGQTHPLKALRALLESPSEIWNFALLARDGRAAFAALRRVALLGPDFGFV